MRVREPWRGGSPRSVLVDARGLYTSGIGRYLREILARLLSDERFSRITLLGEPEQLHGFLAPHGEAERLRVLPFPSGFYRPAAQLAWLRLRASGAIGADVAFFPHYDVPLLGLPRRSVVTVHDLTHFKVPGAFAWWRRAAASPLLRRAVLGAARVITVSEATRRDLVERFPAAAGRVEVVHNGVAPGFRPLAPGEAAACDSRVPRGRYLLCVGNRKPHKNLAAAVEVLALLRRDLPDLQLVVAGGADPGWERVLRRAEALGVREAIHERDEVGDEELRCLYGRCTALLFPSLYEGFGLPLLEAMACGAPVVASNRASIPEVVGDAGLLADPEEYAAMAAAVLRLEREPELRQALVRRGRERAASFTWERAARRTVDLLYTVAAGEARLEPRPLQVVG
ncbi:glycosyltransferase family 1 protein [soil metagenome]